MANPKVTIGICARNAQNYVSSAIESAIKQDLPRDLLEIIFVDDGSEDHTLSIAQKYASQTDRMMRVFSNKWGGLGKARNTVLDNANGDYIIWLDSDEILEAYFARRQIQLMDQNPQAGIATAKFGILPNENIVLALEIIPLMVEYSIQNWSKPLKLPGTGGTTYRKKAAKAVHGFDESIKTLGEDMQIADRIRKKGWLIIRSDSVLYEKHGNLSTWQALWRRYFNLGRQSRQLRWNNKISLSIYRLNPIASIVLGFKYSFLGCFKTKQKWSLLVTFHFTLKMIAWFYGYSKIENSLDEVT